MNQRSQSPFQTENDTMERTTSKPSFQTENDTMETTTSKSQTQTTTMTIKNSAKRKSHILARRKQMNEHRIGRKRTAVIAPTRTGLSPEAQATLEKSDAKNTTVSYSSQQRLWLTWQGEQGLDPYAATPEDIINYFSYCFHGEGKKISTIRVSRAGISRFFKEAGGYNPVKDPKVEQSLRGLAREAANNGYSPKQAAPLGLKEFYSIKATAHIPRISRGGRAETKEQAQRRGDMDLAQIATMRDGMLRSSEAAALMWSDIYFKDDGTGRVYIRKSKTDQTGKGNEQYLQKETVEYLRKIKPANVDSSTSVFGCSPATISNRIKAAAKAAGLEGKFTGHSPRVGMAVDLAERGASLVEMQRAGRWSSPGMPALYTRSQQAGRGAVHKYFSQD